MLCVVVDSVEVVFSLSTNHYPLSTDSLKTKKPPFPGRLFCFQRILVLVKPFDFDAGRYPLDSYNVGGQAE
jgi:hypothetical protein